MKWPVSEVALALSFTAWILGLFTMYRFFRQFTSLTGEPKFEVFSDTEIHYRFLLDLALVSLFITVHSSSTAQLLKGFLEDTRAASLYRPCYLVFSFASLEVLMYFWHPLGVMWNSQHLVPVLTTLFYTGIVMLVVGALTFSPLDMFGVQWPSQKPVLSKQVRLLYSHMRHPLLLGFFLALFTSPIMTYDRFFLAVSMMFFTYLSSNLQEEDANYVEEQINDIHSDMLEQIKTNWRAVTANSQS